MEFNRQTVVVTGAASGIGYAVAQAAARLGAQIVAFDRDAVALEVMRLDFERNNWVLIPVETDIGDQQSIQRAIAIDMAAITGVDLLVNCAGIVSRGLFETTTGDDWERVLAVNLSGSFYCLQQMVPLLKAGVGRAVVNVASLAAKRVSYTGGVSYTAAKAGLLGLTRHAAFELASVGIRVNAVCPGPVWTAMTQRHISEDERQQVASMIPLGDWLSPDDVAQAILFLGSPAARMITGTTVDIDGGLSLVTGASFESYQRARQ